LSRAFLGSLQNGVGTKRETVAASPAMVLACRNFLRVKCDVVIRLGNPKQEDQKRKS
jgi:riboflavin synthase